MRRADLLPAAMLCFVLSTLGVGSAQTFQTVVDFNDKNDTLGIFPLGTLVQGTDGNLYGTTYAGATYNGGAVFQLTPAGTITRLYTFCSLSNCADGGSTSAGVIQGIDGNLYGVTQSEGLYGWGTAFQLTLSGTLTVLYQFCPMSQCADEIDPTALIQGSDGNLYGMASVSDGNVFQLALSGTLTVLSSFCSMTSCVGNDANTLVQDSDGNFYGTTTEGGVYYDGTVFKLIPSATTLTRLYSFCAVSNCLDGGQPGTIIDGRDGNLYGVTASGGTYNGGTVFDLSPSGTLTTLYSFCLLTNCADGKSPKGLVLGSDGNFYGTTYYGGANRRDSCTKSGCGTFFRLTPGGVLTTLYNFCSQWDCTDGELPLGLVQTSSGTFYGTTGGGGTSDCTGLFFGCGTVWSWSPSVALAPTFTPLSLSFGNQAVNTTSLAKSVNIKNVNTGTATLDFSNFTVNPPFAISSSTCGATLAASKTCAVEITFTPTALGASSGTLSVADNAPGSPQTVTLSGTGVAQATVTPASLTFGNVKVGTTSVAKKVTLKNNLPTTLTGISYSTAAPFAVSASACGTTLASKASCTISVTFSPTTVGSASGTLNVTDSANNSPQSVSLGGTGD